VDEGEISDHLRAIVSRATFGTPDGPVALSKLTPLAAGWQSEAPSRATVCLDLVVKAGTAQLLDDASLMRVVNEGCPGVFPAVVDCRKVGDGDVLLVMEFIAEPTSFHKHLFVAGSLDNRSSEAFAAELTAIIQSVHAVPLWREARVEDPYTPRLREKIAQVVTADRELSGIWDREIQILDRKIDGLNGLLGRIETRVNAAMASWRTVTLHGDPHIGNILYGGRGQYRVRMIDPNSPVSPGDPVYDFGKLLHWVTPPGWAAADVTAVSAGLEHRADRLSFSPTVNERATLSFERTRVALEEAVRERLRVALTETEALRLPLATATAHVGLARLLARDGELEAARFSLAYALWELAACVDGFARGATDRNGHPAA
jgi:aminoglycoside phosphotransferase (APT) family kinase protein